MGILNTPGNGSGGSGLVVRTEHNFANASARDTYFPTHLAELKQDMTYVWLSDTGKFFKWIGASTPTSYSNANFKEVTPVIRGERGLQGDAFKYTDFTAEQLASLKGKAFEYSDFTQDQINGLKVKGDTGSMPRYDWQDTSIRFENVDGSMGNYVNLKGETGAKPKHEFKGTELRLENPDGTWGAYSNLIGKTGLSAYEDYKTTVIAPEVPLTKENWIKSLNGQGFNILGNYDQFVPYHNLDVVTYSNKMWTPNLSETENKTGITGNPPSTINGKWILLLEVVVDSSSVIRDDLENSTSHTYSVNKIREIDQSKANKDSVLLKGSTIPFTATLDGEPVSYKQLKDSEKLINMDNIQDGTTYVKSENNFDDNFKAKLNAMQDSNKGFFASTILLKDKFPNGNTELRVGDFAIVGGDGGGTYWFFNANRVWEDTGSKNTTGLSEAIYDPRSIRKDIFSMDSMTETDEKKILTKLEREKLVNVDTNKIDGIPVESSSRYDKTVLTFDNAKGKYIHNPFIEGDMIASFTGDNIKRIDMIGDKNFNKKPAYLYLDSTTEQVYRWHRPSLAFYEFRGQNSGQGIFPLSPVDGQEFQGLETIYKWDNNQKSWMILTTKLENQSLIRTTWGDYGEWVTKNPTGTGVFYIISEGKVIDYYNGIGVESTHGRGYDGGTRPTGNTDKTKLFVDPQKKLVYMWNDTHKYWEVKLESYIEGFLDMQQTVDGIVRYDFNTIEGSQEKDTWSIQYNTAGNSITSWLMSTRSWQHVKVIMNYKNDTENLIKKQGYISSTTMPLPEIITDGVEGEITFTCQKSRITGMAFGYRYVKLKNNFFITEKWLID